MIIWRTTKPSSGVMAGQSARLTHSTNPLLPGSFPKTGNLIKSRVSAELGTAHIKNP